MSSLNPFAKKKDAGEAKSDEPAKVVETKKEDKKNTDAPIEGDPTVSVAKNTEESKNEICQMKRGDYMIHVYVEQAKNLKVPPEDTVDPIVQVFCLDERKYTTAQDDINNTGVAIWNEHIFFEPKNKETPELEQGKIIIKMLDKGFYKDALIGYYEFDLAYIY